MTVGELDVALSGEGWEAAGAAAEAGVLMDVIEGGGGKKAKNRAAKVLARGAAGRSEALVAAWPRLAGLVRSGDTIVRWNATTATGEIATALGESRVGEVLDDLCGDLGGASMVTAGHAATCLAKVVAAGVAGRRRAEVVAALSGVDGCGERERACNAIVAGKVLEGLKRVLVELEGEEREAVLALARRHVGSDRKGLAAVAAQVVKTLVPR